MEKRYENFYATTLITDIGASDTEIRVSTPPKNTKGTLVLEPRNSSKREIIEFDGLSDNLLLNVVRGAEDSVATNHARNSVVQMNVTAGMLDKALYSQSMLEDLMQVGFVNFIESGLEATQVSGLNWSFSSGVVWIRGKRIKIEESFTHTFGDKKNVAVDIDMSGKVSYIEESFVSLTPTLPEPEDDKVRIWSAYVDASRTGGMVWQSRGATKPDSENIIIRKNLVVGSHGTNPSTVGQPMKIPCKKGDVLEITLQAKRLSAESSGTIERQIIVDGNVEARSRANTNNDGVAITYFHVVKEDKLVEVKINIGFPTGSGVMSVEAPAFFYVRKVKNIGMQILPQGGAY